MLIAHQKPEKALLKTSGCALSVSYTHLNLKNLVDKDIADHYEAYSDVVSVPGPNIDFRLVPTLEVFFQRNAEVLTTDINNLLAWQPGDIVTFESSHVAIVSSIRNIWGRPYICLLYTSRCV